MRCSRGPGEAVTLEVAPPSAICDHKTAERPILLILVFGDGGLCGVKAGDIQELTLSRGPCFGTCPVFRFTATSHGRYSYDGGSYAELKGPRTGRFPSYLFTRLAEVCVDLRMTDLDDRYEFGIEDAPYVRVEVRHLTGLKVVHSDGGDLGPARLWAFAALIEFAMWQAFEVEDRDASRKPQSKPRRTRNGKMA